MHIFYVLMLALALALDAMAVSFAAGITLKGDITLRALRMPLSFGLFQAAMPYAGWRASYLVGDALTEYDHWIAFVLLAGIGSRMIYEARVLEPGELRSPFDMDRLIILSLATSMDALAVGVTLYFLDVKIAGPAVIIGVVTFFLSAYGIHLGGRVGRHFEGRLELAAGVLLILIGTEILLRHLL